MDINPQLNIQNLLTLNKPVENSLNLKIGQQLDAKVLSAYIQATKNTIILSLGNSTISVLSNQPTTLQTGQGLKLQVAQLVPSIEFKITEPLSDPKNQTTDLRLKLITTARDGGSVAASMEPARPIAREGGSVATGMELVRATAGELENVATGKGPTAQSGVSVTLSEDLLQANDAATLGKQQFEAKIIGIVGNKIQLQVFSNSQTSSITIDRSQLTNAPTNLDVGQNLKLDIVKLGIEPEFKLIPNHAPEANGDELLKPSLEAKIIGISGNKIQLQVSANTSATSVTIDRTQLSNAPTTLKVGQNLNLEVIKPGAAPELKVISTPSNIPEVKVAEYTKQFLLRHEASPIFLNQLIKDLPQLQQNPSVSETLKAIAATIIQNLPPKEQLVSSQGLKQAIANSGMFLEAKLSETELIAKLPQLIQNETVPKSLQRVAAELLQNLTPKELLPNGSRSKSATESGLARLLKLNSTGDVDQKSVIPKNDAATQESATEDFKADVLKFIHALKQELNNKTEQQLDPTDLDLLKNLQNKTENTIAKIALDQLMSLPKDDNPKQQWIIDIPFVDRNQAESVRIEIQQDKENKRESDPSNWSVNITITPPELGTIHCMVSFWNGMVNTYFKSRNSQTTELIKQNLDYLKVRLEESGITTGHMNAQDGVQTAPPPQQLNGKQLFDEKA